jgi:tryptophan-rich sensory protein
MSADSAAAARRAWNAPGRSGLVALVFFGALTFLAPLVGARAVSDADVVYAALDKPAWAPPPAVFGPVWTVLYLSIALAAWLVWRRAGWRRGRVALGLWAVQLALNAAWTPAFFGAGKLGLSVAIIAALDAAVVATIAAFARHSRPAAVMLAPYLAWVSFATALDVAIWRLNA